MLCSAIHEDKHRECVINQTSLGISSSFSVSSSHSHRVGCAKQKITREICDSVNL